MFLFTKARSKTIHSVGTTEWEVFNFETSEFKSILIDVSIYTRITIVYREFLASRDSIVRLCRVVSASTAAVLSFTL